MSTKTETTLTTQGSNYAIFQQNDFGISVAEAMAINLEGEPMTAWDFPRITVPGAGGLSWVVPDAEGKERPLETIEGVIVHSTKNRSYWAKEMGEGENSNPDCASPDAEIGRGMFGVGSPANPTGACASCPMSQWGSGKDGNGEACKLSRLIFVFRPEDRVPIVISAPRTSLGNYKKYMLRIGGTGRPLWSVVTKFALERQQAKKSGIAYSQIKFDVAAELPIEEARQFQAVGDSLKAAAHTAEGDVEYVD